MRVSQDSDYEQEENNFHIKPLRQLYAALLLRAIHDIQFPPKVRGKQTRPYMRKDDPNAIYFVGSFYETAMMWVFNEKDYKNKPAVSFSTCCDAMNIEPVKVQKYIAAIIMANKNPAARDKTSAGETSIDSSLFRLL